NTGSGSDAPAMFPSNGSFTQHPLPSPGFPRGEFPWLNGTMERSDLRPPFTPGFVVLRLTLTCPCACVRSCQPDAGRTPGALWCGSPTPPFTDRRRPDLPSSWGTLVCLRPALGPRQDRCTRPYGAATWPPL